MMGRLINQCVELGIDTGNTGNNIQRVGAIHLKGPATFSNCQRPVILLGVSQHTRNITDL